MYNEFIKEIEEKMKGVLANLDKRFKTVRAGRANPSSLDGVMVSYYGSMSPLKQLATISVPEARELLIKPFDRSCLKEMEKAIIASNLGFNPSNDGESIRIVIPALTEERRKELSKQVKAMSEEAKVGIRNIRHEANLKIKNMELAMDDEKSLMKRVQDLVDDYNKDIENAYKNKEEELMTV